MASADGGVPLKEVRWSAYTRTASRARWLAECAPRVLAWDLLRCGRCWGFAASRDLALSPTCSEKLRIRSHDLLQFAPRMARTVCDQRAVPETDSSDVSRRLARATRTVTRRPFEPNTAPRRRGICCTAAGRVAAALEGGLRGLPTPTNGAAERRSRAQPAAREVRVV